MTRSPNSLASTENAPGPSKKSAAEVNIPRILIVCSAKNRFATAAMQATIESTGVRNPTTRASEIRTIKETTNQYRALEEKLNRCVRFNANIAAAVILKSSSPIPGPP